MRAEKMSLEKSSQGIDCSVGFHWGKRGEKEGRSRGQQGRGKGNGATFNELPMLGRFLIFFQSS